MRVARVLVAVSLFGLSGAAQAKKDDAAEIKGDWAIVAMKIGERSAPADLIKGLTSRFDGQGYSNRTNDQIVEEGTYKIDAEKSPRAIDFEIKKGPDAGKTQLGVFSVDGDTLTLCVSEPGADKRPASLEPKAESKAMIFIMKRAKR